MQAKNAPSVKLNNIPGKTKTGTEAAGHLTVNYEMLKQNMRFQQAA